MHTIGLLFNPISGSGRGKKTAHALAEALRAAGFTPILRESQPVYDPTALQDFLAPLDALLVIGGDGTIRALLDILSKTATPVYLVPSGNESLFARHFGMSRDASRILAALSGARIAEVPIAQTNGSFFFTMASIGLDSLVVGKIARTRRGPIGHIGYLKPTLQSLAGFSSPPLTIRVDDRPLVQAEPGFVIVANTSQYARNLRLVPEATGTQELLHVRFFPYRGISHYLPWIWNLATGTAVSLKNSLYITGKHCSIETSTENIWPIQADGEYVGDTPVRLESLAKRIKVLLPSQGRAS